MKKIFLSLVLSLFLLPLTANSAAIEIISTAASPSGGVSNGSSNFSASGTHGGVNGAFEDRWSLTFPVPPASNSTLSLIASKFSSFTVGYNFDNSNNFITFTPTSVGPNAWSISPISLGGISPIFVKFTGVGSDGQYALNIQASAPSAVPVPAAVWLFGSALMGLVGVSRRKKA